LTSALKPNIPSRHRVLIGVLKQVGMRPFRKLGLRLARIKTIRRAIDERVDLSPFKAKPSARLMIGVGLIGLSMLLGWPLIGVMGSLAIYFREPLIAVIGGPAAYGLSWAVYGLGLLIAGREALYYMNVFNKWFARVVVEKMIGSPPLSPEEVSEEIPEELQEEIPENTKAEKDPASD
jgi:hypothetical protein